jgi:ribosomal protein S27E
MNVTYSRLPTPPYWPQCAWDGTQTIYPATQTAFQQVDCKGCIDVQVHQTPIVHCPAMIINTTTSVATPTTQYMTVCSPTTAFSQIGGRGVAAVASPTINNVAPAAITSCLVPTTLWVSAALVGGPKSTVYQRMVTETQQVECHGCSLVVSIKLGGQGPLWKPTATMTSAIGTSTVYQCG